MKIGFVGLGRLGFPTALAIESRGHCVFGCDPASVVARILKDRQFPYREQLAQEYLDRSEIELLSMEETVNRADLIIVTIQTPHAPKYEGVTRLPEDRRDFDYAPLKAGMTELSQYVARIGEPRVVVIVSTVLPGTLRREILPLLSPLVKLCYNPFFIAMGTTINDFFNPEFVVLGVEDEGAAEKVEALYKSIHDAVLYKTSLENAELIKTLYNTFISTKIGFANTVMEMCHLIPGGDVDNVMEALGLADQRLISSRYFSGGMGDGGGCHPRDNIALSHLSRQLSMSTDWFEFLMLQREKQTEWLADLVDEHCGNLPLVILGTSFKPESNLSVGSPALLLKNILVERGKSVGTWDPYIDLRDAMPVEEPSCYFIGTRHPDFVDFPFPDGSVVVDPWRYVPDRVGVTVIRVGAETS